MPRFDATNASCFVFTFKEGLLSPAGHDLRLRVERFSIEVEESSIVARFFTASLVVDTAMKEGREAPSALSERDKAKIAAHIRDDVLHSAKYPEATFRSSSVERRADGGYDISGEFTLHGVTRALQASTRATAHGQRLELVLHQPDYSITPFTALMGTLKVRADVHVLIETR